MTVTRVRPMVPDDLAAVLAIEAGANPVPWGPADFAPYLADPARPAGSANRGWVVAVPLVAGFACGAVAADEAELQSIAVASEHRGRGLGSELMRRFLDWAGAAGAVRAHLEVREGNAAARAFYLRWGFADSGRRPRYYRDNGEAAVLMSRAI